MMQAVRIEEAKKPLKLEKVPIPEPQPGEVLIKIGACAVCYRDLLDAGGAYPWLNPPVTTGHEFAGEILKFGSGKSKWFQVGDRVISTHYGTCHEDIEDKCDQCAKGNSFFCNAPSHQYGVTTDGGYAEYTICKETSLVKIPNSIPFEQACFLFCTAAVAYRALKEHAHLMEGERVLITGATGGVGIHAVQLAKKYFKASNVIAITSNDNKVETLKKHGADEVIVSKGAFDKEISAPVDVVLELVGEPTFAASLRSLKMPGRLVIVGNITASKVMVNPGFLITKEISIHGSRGASPENIADVVKMVANGVIKPVVAKVLPLHEAVAAQEMLKNQQVCGRIVLVPPHNAKL